MNIFQPDKTTPEVRARLLYEESLAALKQGEWIVPLALEPDFFNFNQLSSNQQLDLIHGLSKLKALPPKVLDWIDCKQRSFLDVLPHEMLYDIVGYLKPAPDSFSALVGVDKWLYGLFQLNRILAKFLQYVACGNQDKAKSILILWQKDQKKQDLLCQKGAVTDYSGRQFKHITAYEYAYWARDIEMCQMLLAHMDLKTKAKTLIHCQAIDARGLYYTQHGREYCTMYFDIMPFCGLLKKYLDSHAHWLSEQRWGDMKAAWMDVGRAQRDVPACLMGLCYGDNPLPDALTYYNYISSKDERLYPLSMPASSGLGVEFALYRDYHKLMAADGVFYAQSVLVNGFDALLDHELNCMQKDLQRLTLLDAQCTEGRLKLIESLQSAKPESRIALGEV